MSSEVGLGDGLLVCTLLTQAAVATVAAAVAVLAGLAVVAGIAGVAVVAGGNGRRLINIKDTVK